MLGFADIVLRYAGVERYPVLQGVSGGVAAGEAVALVGPSGSGKTSLLFVLGGLLRPTSGTLDIAGVADFYAAPDIHQARVRAMTVGFVFQRFHLVPYLTALQNVERALLPTIESSQQRTDRASEALAQVGLGGKLDRLPGTLSGGEQQRVAVARAAVKNPQVLLCDEPTGNLDSTNTRMIMDLLMETHDRVGGALLVVTHDLEIASRLDGRAEMLDGKLTWTESCP